MPRLIPFATASSTLSHDHPKPERRVDGNPLRTTHEYYANSSGEVSCGVWSCETGSWRIAFDEGSDEYFHVLQGRIRITGPAGERCEFGPGEACVIPAGYTGLFEVLEPVTKHYVMVKRRSG